MKPEHCLTYSAKVARDLARVEITRDLRSVFFKYLLKCPKGTLTEIKNLSHINFCILGRESGKQNPVQSYSLLAELCALESLFLEHSEFS